MKKNCYPLLFQPAVTMRPWGSKALLDYFPITLDNDELPGEVFLAMNMSEVSNGDLAGTPLSEVAKMGSEFMGRRRAPNGFPLRVKVFATGQPLAIQVHPSDTFARQEKVSTNAKAWYILDATANCHIHAELKADHTRQQLLSLLGSSKLYESINTFDALPGESYYLPSGRVHGVGAGAVIVSVEESNPTTYVLGEGEFHEYDDSTSIDCDRAGQYINFNDRTNPRTVSDQTRDDTRNRKLPLVNTNPVFSLEEVRLVARMHHRTKNDSYHILVPLDAPVEVSIGKTAIEVPRLHACLIPAKSGFYNTTPISPTRMIRVS